MVVKYGMWMCIRVCMYTCLSMFICEFEGVVYVRGYGCLFCISGVFYLTGFKFFLVAFENRMFLIIRVSVTCYYIWGY